MIFSLNWLRIKQYASHCECFFPCWQKCVESFPHLRKSYDIGRIEDCPCSHDLDLQLQSLQVLHLPRRMFGDCHLNLQKQTGWHPQIETLLGTHPFISHTTCHVSRHPWYQSIIAGEALCEWWKPHGRTAQPNHCSPRLSLHPNGFLRVAGSALWCVSVMCDPRRSYMTAHQKIADFQFPIKFYIYMHLVKETLLRPFWENDGQPLSKSFQKLPSSQRVPQDSYVDLGGIGGKSSCMEFANHCQAVLRPPTSRFGSFGSWYSYDVKKTLTYFFNSLCYDVQWLWCYLARSGQGVVSTMLISRLFSHRCLHRKRGHSVIFGMKEIDGDSSS